ncbi:unnamed protein product, partial [marine sediment metagenome]
MTKEELKCPTPNCDGIRIIDGDWLRCKKCNKSWFIE